MKTPLQMFEEREQEQSCLQCQKLVEKQGATQKIYFCGHNGKIILPMFLGCSCRNLKGCGFERKAE